MVHESAARLWAAESGSDSVKPHNMVRYGS